MQEQEAPAFTEESDIAVTVNGHHYERRVPVRLLLSDFLRHELHLTGTHIGCEHGVCGCCTASCWRYRRTVWRSRLLRAWLELTAICILSSRRLWKNMAYNVAS